MNIKRFICLAAVAAMLPLTAFADYSWADAAVSYCQKKKIIQGMDNGDLALGNHLTNEQMAKMLVESFEKTPENGIDLGISFTDIEHWRWSFKYIYAFQNYVKKKDTAFKPTENVTREAFAASLVLISGLTESNIRNRYILDQNFDDYKSVDSDYKKLICIAVERGYFKGDDGKLRPKELLTRAEACSLIYRVLESKAGNLTLDLGVRKSETPLISGTQVTIEQAKAWAKSKGAHERFIAIADYYWYYGRLTGIRPELLYAQAAKETAYGKYTGQVAPEQNNWAGIKTKNATGDKPSDHDSFATPDDGVRAHFNHMSAYIGLQPIGEPHGRYYSVKSLSWAGTIKTLEELGGKWCPDLYYGYSILHDYLEPMMNTK